MGAFYVVGPIMEKDALRGFLLMDRSATNNDEHDGVYEI